MCPRAILGPEDTAGVKTDKALFSRVFLSTAEAGVGGCGGEQDLSDNKQKLWFQVVITQLRNHSNTDLEDHLRQVMSQDLSEEVTRAQIDKTAPATEAAERITSTQTLKQGRAWRIQRAGKAMNLEHQELERPVLRWGLRVSRRPFLGKDSSSQPLQGSFWCCGQHRVHLWSTESTCGTQVSVVSDTHIIGTTVSPLSCTWITPLGLIPWSLPTTSLTWSWTLLLARVFTVYLKHPWPCCLPSDLTLVLTLMIGLGLEFT